MPPIAARGHPAMSPPGRPRPLLARQGVGPAQREDAEAGADVVAARLAQARGRQRLLEGQRPAIERAGAPGRRRCSVMTSVQVPWTFRPSGRREYGGQDCCGLNVAKNGAPPLWIGVAALSSKIVLVKLAVVGAGAHAAEEGDLARIDCRRVS